MADPFVIGREARGDLTVLEVDGELDLATSSVLEAQIRNALRGGLPSALAIDLNACEFIDSTGVSLLIHSQEVARGKSVRFALICGAETQPYRVLTACGCLPDRMLRFRSRGAAEVALCSRPRRRFQRSTEVFDKSLLQR